MPPWLSIFLPQKPSFAHRYCALRRACRYRGLLSRDIPFLPATLRMVRVTSLPGIIREVGDPSECDTASSRLMYSLLCVRESQPRRLAEVSSGSSTTWRGRRWNKTKESTAPGFSSTSTTRSTAEGESNDARLKHACACIGAERRECLV